MIDKNLANIDVLDCVDSFNKKIAQARSVISALIVDDAFKSLSSCDVANLLSIVADRLDDMKKIHACITSEALK